jgi:hypothetical protein
MTRPATKRRFVSACAWLSLVLAAPAAAFAILVALNSVNPLQTIFMTTVVVQNMSGERLQFWVAGRHESGHLRLLPLFATAFPAIPSFRSGGFQLADGASKRIIYDSDDIALDVVVVQRRGGELRVVDAVPENGRRRRSGAVYVIPRIDGLRGGSPAEVAVLTENASVPLRLALVLAGPLIPVGLFWWSRRLVHETPDSVAEITCD